VFDISLNNFPCRSEKKDCIAMIGFLGKWAEVLNFFLVVKYDISSFLDTN
jgi:hypothetical protein